MGRPANRVHSVIQIAHRGPPLRGTDMGTAPTAPSRHGLSLHVKDCVAMPRYRPSWNQRRCDCKNVHCYWYRLTNTTAPRVPLAHLIVPPLRSTCRGAPSASRWCRVIKMWLQLAPTTSPPQSTGAVSCAVRICHLNGGNPTVTYPSQPPNAQLLRK